MKTKAVVAVVVVAVVVVAVSVLSRGHKTRPSQAQVFKIGVVLPLSGDGAAYGKKEKDGVALAIEQANAVLSRSGLTITPIYEDSQGTPAPAVSAVQKLVSVDKVPVVIGDAFSSPTLAMVSVTDKAGVVLMSPSASSPKLSGAGRFFFRVWPSDTAEGSTMAEVAVQQLGLKTFAILHGKNEYGLGLRDIFSAKVKELGGTVFGVEVYNEGDLDFRAQLAKIKETAPAGIYLAGYYKEFAKILKQAKELGISARFLSCGTFHEPQILELAGDAAEGVVFVQPYFDRNSPDPVTKTFVAAYESKYKEEAGVYAAHGYDAALAICEVVKSGKRTPQELREALLAFKGFDGVTGKTTFLEGGDVIKSARVMTVCKGAFTDFRK